MTPGYPNRNQIQTAEESESARTRESAHREASYGETFPKNSNSQLSSSHYGTPSAYIPQHRGYDPAHGGQSQNFNSHRLYDRGHGNVEAFVYTENERNQAQNYHVGHQSQLVAGMSSNSPFYQQHDQSMNSHLQNIHGRVGDGSMGSSHLANYASGSGSIRVLDSCLLPNFGPHSMPDLSDDEEFQEPAATDDSEPLIPNPSVPEDSNEDQNDGDKAPRVQANRVTANTTELEKKLIVPGDQYNWVKKQYSRPVFENLIKSKQHMKNIQQALKTPGDLDLESVDEGGPPDELDLVLLPLVKELYNAIVNTVDLVDQIQADGKLSAPVKYMLNIKPLYIELRSWERVLFCMENEKIGYIDTRMFIKPKKVHEAEEFVTWQERLEAFTISCRNSKAIAKKVLMPDPADRIFECPSNEFVLVLKSIQNNLLKKTNADAGKAARKALDLDEKKRKATSDEDEQDESESEAVEQSCKKRRKGNGQAKLNKARAAPKKKFAKKSKAASEEAQDMADNESTSTFADAIGAEPNFGVRSHQGPSHDRSVPSLHDPTQNEASDLKFNGRTVSTVRFGGMSSAHSKTSQIQDVDSSSAYSHAQVVSRGIVWAQTNTGPQFNRNRFPDPEQYPLQNQSIAPEQAYSHIDVGSSASFASSDFGTSPGNDIRARLYQNIPTGQLSDSSTSRMMLPVNSMDYLLPQFSGVGGLDQFQKQDYPGYEQSATGSPHFSVPVIPTQSSAGEAGLEMRQDQQNLPPMATPQALYRQNGDEHNPKLQSDPFADILPEYWSNIWASMGEKDTAVEVPNGVAPTGSLTNATSHNDLHQSILQKHLHPQDPALES